jgi:hypothetical protein
MKTRTHRRSPGRGQLYWRLTAVLLGAVVLSLGCNPLATMAFIFTPDRLEQPDFPLARKDKETRIAIMVLPYDQFSSDIQMRNADRDLMDKLSKDLKERFKDHSPKVTLVPTQKVVAYLNRHHQVTDLSGKKAGEALGADYVVMIELRKMHLLHGVSGASMFRGHAEMVVQLTDVEKPEGEGVELDRNFECQYPKDGGFADRSDLSQGQFYGKFLDRITRELSQLFAPYEPRDRYDSD